MDSFSAKALGARGGTARIARFAGCHFGIGIIIELVHIYMSKDAVS